MATSERAVRRGTLAIIYVAFIALGLPDTVLGAVWPAVRLDFGLPLSAGGQPLLLMTAGAAAASLATPRLLERFGTGAILSGSTLLAAAALFGNALAPAWWPMLVAAVVAGLGAGAIDTALNGYVARHHTARQMNWLHGCWGIGASLGPLVASFALRSTGSWRHGYAWLGAAELALALLFFATLGWWQAGGRAAAPERAPVTSTSSAVAGVVLFGVYGGLEASIGLWSASYLVATRGASLADAGAAVGVYWGGLTAGRLLLGLFSTGQVALPIARGGLIAVFPGLGVLAFPQLPYGVLVAALALLGMALGPVYPTFMHDTPRRHGDRLGARLVGYQVAACSIGIAVLPWAVGLLLPAITIARLPLLLAGLATVALVLERLRRSEPRRR
jgi:fucose permease